MPSTMIMRFRAMVQMFWIWNIREFMSGARRQERTSESGRPEALVYAEPLAMMWEEDLRARIYIGMKTSWMLTDEAMEVDLWVWNGWIS